jgi:hypothetical protein
VSELFEKLVISRFVRDIMDIKNLILYGTFPSFEDGKGQVKTGIKTSFCGVCSLPNNFLSIIKSMDVWSVDLQHCFILVKLQKKLKLNEFMLGDTERYIPDIL